MSKNVKLMSTVSGIYRDIITYKTFEMQEKPLDNLVLQSKDDEAFARVLVSYLKGGSFLPKTTKIAVTASTMLQVYQVSMGYEDLMSVLGVSINTLYKANKLIEQSLKDIFGDLGELWSSRNFEEIASCMENNSVKYLEPFETLISNSYVNFGSTHLRPMELDFVGSELREYKGEALERYVNCVKLLREMSEVGKQLSEYTTEIEVIRRALLNNKVIPSQVLDEINPSTVLEDSIFSLIV